MKRNCAPGGERVPGMLSFLKCQLEGIHYWYHRPYGDSPVTLGTTPNLVATLRASETCCCQSHTSSQEDAARRQLVPRDQGLLTLKTPLGLSYSQHWCCKLVTHPDEWRLTVTSASSLRLGMCWAASFKSV